MENGIRLAMLASGSGTTVEAILQAREKGSLPGVDPVLLVIDHPEAGAAERARAQGLKNIFLVDRKQFKNNAAAFGQELLNLFESFGINLVGQYGWLSKTPENVIAAFSNGERIINQHPGPVPWFGGKGLYGIRVHAAVLYFVQAVRRSGRPCYGTYVVSQRTHPKYDLGPVLQYRVVPILDGDTPESLQARALPEEWHLQIETLQRFANGYTGVLEMPPFVYPDEVHLLKQALAYGKVYRS